VFACALPEPAVSLAGTGSTAPRESALNKVFANWCVPPCCWPPAASGLGVDVKGAEALSIVAIAKLPILRSPRLSLLKRTCGHSQGGWQSVFRIATCLQLQLGNCQISQLQLCTLGRSKDLTQLD